RKKYGGRLDDSDDVAFRVIADHLRMLTFAITDGAMPANKGRGAGGRSVLRRGFPFGYQRFEHARPVLYRLVPVLVNQMGGVFPELKFRAGQAQDVIRGEEVDFLKTIERGLKLFQEAAERARPNRNVISGKDVFDLHTTYGLYIDITEQ